MAGSASARRGGARATMPAARTRLFCGESLGHPQLPGDAPGVGDAVALRPGVGGIEQVAHEAGDEAAAFDCRLDRGDTADPGLAQDPAAELRADDRFMDHLVARL